MSSRARRGRNSSAFQVQKRRNHRPSRNCFINKLPPELLAEIFLYCREDQRRTNCFHLAGVCGYWRKTALTCHALWSTIVCGSVYRADLSLRLSGSLPVDVTLMIPRLNWYNRLPAHGPWSRTAWQQIVTDHGRRFRSLCIQAMELSAIHGYIEALDQPGEALSHLTLENQLARGYNSLEAKFKSLQRSLFAGEMKKLQALKVVGITWPWNIGFYRGLPKLTKLILKQPLLLCDTADILACLGSLPLLRYLQLFCTDYNYDEEDNEVDEDEKEDEDDNDLDNQGEEERSSVSTKSLADLPNLRELRINRISKRSLRLLKALILPPACRVLLSEDSFRLSDDDFAALALKLQAVAQDATFAALYLDDSESKYSFCFYPRLYAADSDSLLELHIKVDCDHYEYGYFDPIAFRALLSASRLRALMIHYCGCYDNDPQDFFSELLAGLEGVRTLVADDLRFLPGRNFLSNVLPNLDTLLLNLIGWIDDEDEEEQAFYDLEELVKARVRLGKAVPFTISLVEEDDADESGLGQRIYAHLSTIAGCVCVFESE